MAKQAAIKQDGIVEVALPNAMFKVRLENDHLVLGQISGKMRKFYIKILHNYFYTAAKFLITNTYRP